MRGPQLSGLAVLDLDGVAAAVAVLTGARGRRQERRCSTVLVKVSAAMSFVLGDDLGEEEGMRRRLARRRMRQCGAAYRTEVTATSGRSCRNGGEARQATMAVFGPSQSGHRPFIGSKTASTTPSRSANRSKALCDTDDDKWAPRVSEFKIQNKPQIWFLAWEK
jgi:hypothetical protein